MTLVKQIKSPPCGEKLSVKFTWHCMNYCCSAPSETVQQLNRTFCGAGALLSELHLGPIPAVPLITTPHSVRNTRAGPRAEYHSEGHSSDYCSVPQALGAKFKPQRQISRTERTALTTTEHNCSSLTTHNQQIKQHAQTSNP